MNDTALPLLLLLSPKHRLWTVLNWGKGGYFHLVVAPVIPDKGLSLVQSSAYRNQADEGQYNSGKQF